MTAPADFAARLVRAVDAIYDGEHSLALTILEDVIHDSFELDVCGSCGEPLTRAEALDARVTRRRGYTGACGACLYLHSMRAA